MGADDTRKKGASPPENNGTSDAAPRVTPGRIGGVHYLQILALIMTSVSFALYIMVDSFKSYAPKFPAVAIMIIATLAHASSTPLAHTAGLFVYEEYQLWQPFSGGGAFVLLQGIAWFFYSTSLMFAVIFTNALDKIPGFGIISIVGGFNVTAAVLTAVSVHYYRPDLATPPELVSPSQPRRSSTKGDSASSTTTPQGQQPRFFSHLFSGDGLVVFLIAFGQIFLLAFADFYISEYAREVTKFASAANLVAATITHGVLGPRRFPGKYLIWQPFLGSFKFVMLQAIGWSSFGVANALLLAVLLPSAGFEFGSVRGLITAVGILFFLSQLLLLGSLSYFDPYQAPDSVTSARRGMKRQQSDDDLFISVEDGTDILWTGERLLFTLLALLSELVFVGVDIMIYGKYKLPLDATYLCIMASACMYVSTPLTHWLGGRRQFRDYHFWQPFIGGRRYVTLQALGWTSYSVSVMFVMLWIVNGVRWGGISAPALFGFLSQLLVLASLSYYKGKRSRYHTPIGAALNGELMISIFLVVGSASVFAVVDRGWTDWPEKQLLGFAMLSWSLSAPLAHLSGRRGRKTYPLFAPFTGGHEFIALQAVGWTFYAVVFIFYAIIFLNVNSLQPLVWDGFLNIAGLLGLVPVLLLLMSVQFYQPPELDVSGTSSDDNSTVPTVNVRIEYTSGKARLTRSDLEAAITELEGLLNEQQSSPAVAKVLQSSLVDFQEQLARLSGTRKKTKSGAVVGLNTNGVGSVGITLLSTALSVGGLWLYLIAELSLRLVSSKFDSVPVLIYGFGFFAFALAHIVTQVFDGPLRYPDSFHLWQPFRGGFKYVLLQVLGWTLSGVGIMLSVVSLYNGLSNIHINGFVSFTGGVGFAGHIILFTSLRHFDPEDVSDEQEASSVTGVFFKNHADNIVSFLLTLGALSLFAVVNLVRRHYGTEFVAPIILMASLAIFGALALAFYAARKRQAESGEDDLWFGSSTDARAGATMLELLGWVLHGLSFGLVVVSIYYAIKRTHPLEWLGVYTGVSVVVAQSLIVVSVVYTWVQGRPEHEKASTQQILVAGALDARSALVTWGLYTLHLPVFAVWIAGCFTRVTNGSVWFFTYLMMRAFVGPFMILLFMANVACLAHFLYSGDYESAVWASISLWYNTTYNDSHTTGRRRWYTCTEWKFLWDSCARYFSYSVIAHGKLDPKATYLFGMHPHGIYPFTCFWGCLCTAFTTKYPGIIADVFGAAVLTKVPVLRDMIMWMGARDVSRPALRHALSNHRSGILVPGGQREMRECRVDDDNVILISRHKGFVRVAIQEGASLVPLLSVNENKVMDNINAKSMQSWFVNKVGFGYPHFPYGRWYLPIPRPVKLTMIVGEPIATKKEENPSQETIDKVHREYFAQIRMLWDKYRPQLDGVPKHVNLIIKDD